MTLALSRPVLLIAAVLGALLALSFARPPAAEAHPLGNFTVNRYSRIELYSDALRVHYVVDMAEIPAFQEIKDIDTNGDGERSESENAGYLSVTLPELVDGLSLTIDDDQAHLAILASDIAYPEGQAGLQTLRLSAVLQASLDNPIASFQYHDTNFSDRVGWKEIVVTPAEGVVLQATTASADDVSNALTEYPDGLLSSPLDVTSASASFDATNAPVAPPVSEMTIAAAPESATSRPGSGFAGLIDAENLTLTVILISLLAAFGFGALHALEPGHGKTLVAAYFVGVKGTARQALSLGAIIAGTHTFGVMVIGLVTLFCSQFILPERLYPWLSLASGLMVLALGVRLIASRARFLRLPAPISSLLRRGRSHDHAYHDHGHTHAHMLPTTDSTPPWRSLFALGLADGLTPSPSALIVLLAAVSLDRIGLGIALVTAFSVGLSAVLTAVCLGLVYARGFLDWLSSRHGAGGAPLLGRAAALVSPEGVLLRIVPVGGALALVAVGTVLTLRALAEPSLPLL